jgi:hydrogenase maturation protein HypF
MKVNRIKLPFKIKKPVLALGPQAKNSVCFAKGHFAYLSPVRPDLSNIKDFLKFQSAVRYFLKKSPEIIACDLHPEYESTKYARQLSLPVYPIQHHHAHIASCMVENYLGNEKVIGVAFDGTGLGSDNNIWGAEFLICNYKGFQRAAHLKEMPLLGGENAILEPARVTQAWLYSIYKDKFLDLKLDWAKKIDKKKWQVLKNMYLTGFNSPLASSMGRLFDAAASVVLAKDKANFEAELAIELERTAERYTLPAIAYKFVISGNKGGYIINPALMFKEMVFDLKSKEAKEKIANRFHLTVAQMIRKISLILRQETHINKVVLSGGVFQNNLLLCMALDLLYKEDFKVYTHKYLSCNDSCICLGEAALAGF